ncbi:pyridoxamine 5'-phosphate oxidase family protein [Streptomyces sp. NPDC020480]|uniref:pyridoxamine 5'-phosphate oxidase family protein n=1 Tax=Streptomyces sp. NPDC020480 TaxID=3365076 RepID=UPI0037A25288
MENTAAPAAATPRPRPQPFEPARRRRSAPWLALVAAGYALVQLLVVVPHIGHALGWDESVYVSQVDPRNPAAYFSAPRSRGISMLVAPVVAVTSSIPVLRVLLAVLSAVALYAAFRVWRRLLGPGTVALAALLFAGLWITQISGPAVMPNLWVALGAVAAVGWFLRLPAERNARWWLTAVIAGVTLVRTPDGGWLALPLLGAAVVVRAWRPALPALLGGLALGAMQWVGEAYARFGGIMDRLKVSSDVEGGMGLHFNVGAALRSLNGPQLCRPCEVPLRHPELTAWWLALPLLTAAAIVMAVRDRRDRRERVSRPGAPHLGHSLALSILPIVCATALALPYLLLIGYFAPRFLMPSYALLALPIAELALRTVKAARSPQPVAVAVGVVITLQLASQYVVLGRSAAQSERVNGSYRTAAAALHRLGLRPPCLVAGDRALPIAYHAGCASAQTSGNNRSIAPAALVLRSAREPTALLTHRSRPRPPAYAQTWVAYPLPGTGWIAHLPPDQAREVRSRQKESGNPGSMGPMMTATTTSWGGFEAAEPEFSAVVRERFQRYRHHVLATLRQDGSPRVTGLEADFRFGEMWLGMMPDSRKALDLRRDARFAIHANPGPDTGMDGGDVRVSGRAVEVTDPEMLARFAGEVHPPEPFHLFRVEVTEVVRTAVEGSDPVLQTWRPGEPVRTTRRGADDSAPQGEGGS